MQHCVEAIGSPVGRARLHRRGDGEGERILVTGIVERFTRYANGELELLTEGSTLPVAKTRTHAGLVKVQRFAFDLP